MFRNKKYWIILIALIAVIGGGYLLYTNVYTTTAAESEEPDIQTAVARQGDLIVFASGAGQVIPATEIVVGFQENGTLSEILVNVGDQVQVGQVLARLQTNETPESIAAALADAELNAIQAQQELDGVYENAEMDAAQALLSLEAAQQALDDSNNSELTQAQAQQSVTEAEEAVEEAQRNVYISQSTASQADIDAAYVQILLAETALEKAQAKYAPYENKSEDNLKRAQYLSQLSSAQGNYDQAVRNYNAMTSTMDESSQSVALAELATAQAQLEDAQREWARVKDGPSAGEDALAEAQLAAAQTEWERVKDGPDPDDVAMAEAKLASAQAKLTLAQKEQAVVDLVAPMDGTILSTSASVGESVGTTAFITLADLSLPLLEVYLDETDLDKVATGFEVEVIFDALPDEIFTGHVVQVNPSLETVSGVQAIKALVQLDGSSFAKPQTLPVGLNASVDVIGGRAENTVLIPVEALRELGPNEYAVFVMEDNEPKLRVVEVGLVDFTSAEILSGLEPGEVVTTGIVETE